MSEEEALGEGNDRGYGGGSSLERSNNRNSAKNLWLKHISPLPKHRALVLEAALEISMSRL